MNEPNHIKNEIFSKSNAFVILGVYLTTSVYLTSQVLKEGNLAAPDLSSKIILILVVLLIASPAFAIGGLIMKLRIQHFIKTKDTYEFITPTKGSLGNPDFSVYMNSTIKKLWRIFIVLLVLLLISTLAFIIAREIL